jgi:hypothetical protein
VVLLRSVGGGSMDIALCASVAKHVTYNRHVESLSIICLTLNRLNSWCPAAAGSDAGGCCRTTGGCGMRNVAGIRPPSSNGWSDCGSRQLSGGFPSGEEIFS